MSGDRPKAALKWTSGKLSLHPAANWRLIIQFIGGLPGWHACPGTSSGNHLQNLSDTVRTLEAAMRLG